MTTFVIGGHDSEMVQIESILIDNGYTIVRAEKDGKRVRRHEAYDADYPKPRYDQVWIECSHHDYSKKEMKSLGIEILDHHHPGDSGYGKSPLEYFEASSIGQLHKLLDLTPSKRSKLTAAADHCLRQAYDNQCPGITREELRAFRLEYYNDPRAEDTLSKIRDHVESCPNIDINGRSVKNISGLPADYRRWLSEVSAFWGIKMFQQSKNAYGHKIYLLHLSSADIQHFMDDQCHDFGVVTKIYGDPKRQFAGCFYSEIYDNPR